MPESPISAGTPSINSSPDFYSVNGLVRATLLESEGQLLVETRRNSTWRFFDNARHHHSGGGVRLGTGRLGLVHRLVNLVAEALALEHCL